MISDLTYANIEDVLTRCFLRRWVVDPEAVDRVLKTPVILKNSVPQDMPPSVEAWVYFTVYKNASRQDSFGGPKNRRFVHAGRIYVEIFVKAGTITGLMNELTADVLDIYQDGSWSPMRINHIAQYDLPDGAHRRASITGDGRWFGTQVNIQWAFDEVK